MTMWAHFERLDDNELPLPTYATECSAGLDLMACLTRACTLIREDGIKEDFYNRDTGGRCNAKPNNINAPKLILAPHETVMMPFGFKCEFSKRYVMQLHIRSSLGLRGLMLANSVGIVDPDYRGEIKAILYNRTNNPIIIDHGMKTTQAVFMPYVNVIVDEREVDVTSRGEGGFGSTGS